MNSIKNLNRTVLHAVRSAITATAKLLMEVHTNASAK